MLRVGIEYVRRHHVGLLALVVALGGTAYAVQTAPKNSVVSKSIKRSAVKGSDIAPRAVGSSKLATARTIRFAGPETVDDGQPPILRSVVIDVPPSGLVEIHAVAEIDKTASFGGINTCFVGVDLPSQGTTPLPFIQEPTTAVGYSRARTAASSGLEGTKNVADSSFLAFEAEPGRRTFRLAMGSVNATCLFRNARMTVVPAA